MFFLAKIEASSSVTFISIFSLKKKFRNLLHFVFLMYFLFFAFESVAINPFFNKAKLNIPS